jgi:excinuclease UvrABC ATPase subunit
MNRMDRPQIDRIEGIPPAIAIDHKDPFSAWHRTYKLFHPGSFLPNSS